MRPAGSVVTAGVVVEVVVVGGVVLGGVAVAQGHESSQHQHHTTACAHSQHY